MPVIKLHANLRSIAGKKKVQVMAKSLKQCFREIAKASAELEEVLFEDEEIRSHFVITVNGHHAIDLDVLVEESDIISIFPPIAGG